MPNCRFHSTIGVEWKLTCCAPMRAWWSNWMARNTWKAPTPIVETAVRINCSSRMATSCCASSPKMWARISTWCWTRSNEHCSDVKNGDPRGPVKAKTAGRGRAQQRVAQHHRKQNIGIEDGDQHRGLTLTLEALRACPLAG